MNLLGLGSVNSPLELLDFVGDTTLEYSVCTRQGL